MRLDQTHAVLFDLDGTLVDSACDLHAALNTLRAELGLASFPFGPFRGAVSQGGGAMLALGLMAEVDAPDDTLLPRFLAYYAEGLAAHSRCFDGVEEVLIRLDTLRVPWGVVTNKPDWLAEPLMQRLGLDQACAIRVAGDTLPTKKPDPAPVLYACAQLAVDPARCLFVGDDQRDIQAGQAAGCPTVLASYGYAQDLAEARRWGASFVIDHPRALLALQ